MDWQNKRVFVTGHTGFKGSWLCLWLQMLGAEVAGYALDYPTEPNLCTLAKVEENMFSVCGDIRDRRLLEKQLKEFQPEIVFHLAAQPLVRESYLNPVETFEINVMGTVNLLEAVRKTSSVKALVNVTSDKCYDNREWVWGYRETDSMGGFDPYSSSKGCAELVTAAYRSSFMASHSFEQFGAAVASARAGNVIGGGDWAKDRLIPDCIEAILNNKSIVIRNPQAIRPWQHVLEPLNGYLLLAEKLWENGSEYAEAWNFGPSDEDAQTVKWIVEKICKLWGHTAEIQVDQDRQPHEAHYLKLDCSKARQRLGWKPRWTTEEALAKVVEWTMAYKEGKDLYQVCRKQIESYISYDDIRLGDRRI